MARGQGWVAAFFSAHITLVNHFCRIRKNKEAAKGAGDTHDLCWKQDLRSWTPRGLMKAESVHFLLSSSRRRRRRLCLFTELFFIWTKKHGNMFFDIQTLRDV